jgi:hypothetical protein
MDLALEIRRRRVEQAAADALMQVTILAHLRQGPAATRELRALFPEYEPAHKRARFWQHLAGMEARGLIQHHKSPVGPSYVGSIWELAGSVSRETGL